MASRENLLFLLFFSSPLVGQITDIARTLQTLPNSDAVFGDFTAIDANGDGNFLFVNRSLGLPGTEDEFLFLSDTSGHLTRAITEGQPAPEGLGTVGGLSFPGALRPRIGLNGTVAITNLLRGTTNARTVLAWNTASGLRQVAREGLPLPDDNSESFEDFIKPVSISATGEVTITAMRDDEIILRENGTNSFTTIRPLELPGGDSLQQIRLVQATPSDDVVIGALYRTTSGLLSTGIFGVPSGASVTARALRDNVAPTSSGSADGVFADIETEFQLNESRAIAFFATVDGDTNFGDGVFFQRANDPTRAVIRANQALSGGALGNRSATFAGDRFDTTFLLSDDGTIYVSGPVTVESETTTRAALISWSRDGGLAVLLLGEELLPMANPAVTLDEIILQDISANGAVSLQARGSNRTNYPYHYHPETGLTLLVNLDEIHPAGLITQPVNLGPELDNNGDAIFTYTVSGDNVAQRVLTIFDADIASAFRLPTPTITVTSASSEVTISGVPNGLLLQLELLNEESNQFAALGSSVRTANGSAIFPGPNPGTAPRALLRVAVAD